MSIRASLKTESDFFFICLPAAHLCAETLRCAGTNNVLWQAGGNQPARRTYNVLWQAGEISGKYSPADYVPKFRDSQNRFLEIPIIHLHSECV